MAFAVGLLAAGLRSVVCYALIGYLISATFALTAIFFAGEVSLTPLLVALLAYNAGIAVAVLAALVVAQCRGA